MPPALDSRSETRERFGFGRKPHGFRYSKRRIPKQLLTQVHGIDIEHLGDVVGPRKSSAKLG